MGGMDKMKNKILAALVVLGVAVSSYAVPSRSLPQDKRGDPIAHPLYGGFSHSRQSGSSEAMVCTGKCLLAGLIMSTGSVASYVRLRDTAAADGLTAGTINAKIRFEGGSESKRNPIALPILCSNGISIQITSVAAGEEVTVLYLDLDD